ncbi:uncharacterized protein LOC136079806 [Hydra vulgaris]|uniref:Uncharacterized protein LOC136079806 n=1 Tax=Hydra vulgaris TaxID=6087 RepID=A0ABM4BTD0_HYDVU
MYYFFQSFIAFLFLNNQSARGSIINAPKINRNFYFNSPSKTRHGFCLPKGYNGGKLEVEIKNISAPTAELEASFFESFFDISKKSSESLKYLTDEAKTTLENIESNLKNVKPLISKLSKVSRCLGMFGFAFGILNDITTPSPDDIMEATNTAIKKLTNEINDKFTDMKDYVDNSILDLKRDLVEKKYLVYENMFKICGQQFEKDQNTCVERMFVDIESNYHSFRPKISEIDRWSNSNKPAIKVVKEIEASFELHRMYCTLFLKVGGVLFQSYEDDKSEEGQFYYAKYAKSLREGAKACIKYTEVGYQWILDIHLSRNNCDETLTCADPEPIKEGWLGVHTTDLYHCSCVYDGAQKGTEVCYHKLGLRYDGKNPGREWKMMPNKKQQTDASRAEVAKRYARSLLKAGERQFLAKEKEVIEEYWNVNVISQIPIWEAIAEKFDQIINDLPPVTTTYSKKKISKSEQKYFDDLYKKAQKHASAFVRSSKNPESNELESEENA